MDQYKGVREEFPVEVDEGKMCHCKDPYSQYYTSTPQHLAEAAGAKLVPMALSVFLTPATSSGWKDHNIPITYVLCEEDYGLHTIIQEKFVKRMEADGANLTVRRMKTDHSPFLHQVDEYLALIQNDLS